MRFGCFEAVALMPTRDVEAAVEEHSSLAVSAQKMPSTRFVRQTFTMADDRSIDGVDDAVDEFDRDAVTLPRARRTARGTGQLPPREDVAQRYALAAERRRLLSHALHANDDSRTDAELASEHAVTDRYVKLTAADLESPRAEVPRRAAGSQPTIRPPLNEAVERLRAQAAECRAQAIALNAKLVLLEADRAKLHGPSQELHAVREQLIESSARLDHAVDEIEAVTAVEEQLSTLR